jgi:hypothetical protein
MSRPAIDPPRNNTPQELRRFADDVNRELAAIRKEMDKKGKKGKKNADEED